VRKVEIRPVNVPRVDGTAVEVVDLPERALLVVRCDDTFGEVERAHIASNLRKLVPDVGIAVLPAGIQFEAWDVEP